MNTYLMQTDGCMFSAVTCHLGSDTGKYLMTQSILSWCGLRGEGESYDDESLGYHIYFSSFEMASLGTTGNAKNEKQPQGADWSGEVSRLQQHPIFPRAFEG